MNTEFKILDNDMIYELCEYLSLKNPLKNTENYVDPYLTKVDFEELSIRDKCFAFKSLFFAKIHNCKIKDVCIIGVSQFPIEINALNISYISSYSEDIIDLIKFSIETSKNLYSQYKLITININDTCNEKSNFIIEKLDFKKSQFLKNEFGDYKNLIVYSKEL